MDNGASFPPHLWAKEPSKNNKRTTNGAEAYHRSFNSMFYHSSPNIFVFLEILTGIQVTVYIKLRCLSKAVGGRKADEERSAFVFKQYGRVKDGEMSFMEYVKSISAYVTFSRKCHTAIVIHFIANVMYRVDLYEIEIIMQVE